MSTADNSSDSKVFKVLREFLWMAVCWNDHNFKEGTVATKCRELCKDLGIDNVDDANVLLESIEEDIRLRMDGATFDNAQEISKQLSEYVDLQCDEMSEACAYMIAVAQYPDYVSDLFYEELVMEMKRQLKNYQTYSRIVTKEETITRTVTELEWDE